MVNSMHCTVTVVPLQLSLAQALTRLCLLLITWATVARSTSIVITRNMIGKVQLTDLTESTLDPSESKLLTDECARMH